MQALSCPNTFQSVCSGKYKCIHICFFSLSFSQTGTQNRNKLLHSETVPRLNTSKGRSRKNTLKLRTRSRMLTHTRRPIYLSPYRSHHSLRLLFPFLWRVAYPNIPPSPVKLRCELIQVQDKYWNTSWENGGRP